VLTPGEGDYLGSPDSGYPTKKPDAASGDSLRDESLEPANSPAWLEDLTTLLLGNGRRCGICWGTGWVDGHRLWGGYRLLLCTSDTPQVTLTEDEGLGVDTDSPTPTLLGPGSVVYDVELPFGCTYLDAVRVRDGLVPSAGGYLLEARVDEGDWLPLLEVLGVEDPAPLGSAEIADLERLQIRLTLEAGARVSHVEIVLRSEDLVNLQLPQLQQAASQELVAPQFSVDFEIDPIVGAIERGTLIEIPGRSGMLGSLWIVTDVEPKKSAIGQVFGVTGQLRSAQPTDVVSAALLDDTNVGVVDSGYTTRGLEPTLGGEASGLGGDTDDTVAAQKRGSKQRVGGGTSGKKSPIILNKGSDLEGW
jgi:hypothetical protein